MNSNSGFTRNRLFGLIGVLWGGGILAYRFLGGGAAPTGGAYAAGQSGAVIFGVLLLIAGLYYLVKG